MYARQGGARPIAPGPPFWGTGSPPQEKHAFRGVPIGGPRRRSYVLGKYDSSLSHIGNVKFPPAPNWALRMSLPMCYLAPRERAGRLCQSPDLPKAFFWPDFQTL